MHGFLLYDRAPSVLGMDARMSMLTNATARSGRDKNNFFNCFIVSFGVCEFVGLMFDQFQFCENEGVGKMRMGIICLFRRNSEQMRILSTCRQPTRRHLTRGRNKS